MKKKLSLNNRRLRAIRKDPIYQAVLVDLSLIGAIEKEVVEEILNSELPDSLVSPLRDDGTAE